MTPEEQALRVRSAQQELDALEVEATAMKERHKQEFQPLKDKAIQLTRIINGDDLHDQHNRAEAERMRQRLIDEQNGLDPFTLSLEAARAEAALKRAEEKARVERRKQYQNERLADIVRLSPPR